MLTISRYAPAIVPRLRFRAPEVIAVLDRVGEEIGLPQTIRVDPESGIASRDLDLRADQRGGRGIGLLATSEAD